MNPGQLVISCEHGGNQIPDAYQYLFADHQEVLESHRGWDPGALEIARFLSDHLHAPLFFHTTTRLLIEMNRSLHHPDLYSEYCQTLSDEKKKQLVCDYYEPYRNQVEKYMAEHIQSKENIIHVSVHTFTPVFKGIRRMVDIGLLFDPDRPEELTFCTNWKEQLTALLPAMEVQFNEPYLGKDDGFTTYLRTKFSSSSYVGIEIEVNQQYIEQPEWVEIQQALAQSLSELLRFLER